MMSLIRLASNWCLSWFRTSVANQWMSYLEHKLERLEKESSRLHRLLSSKEAELERSSAAVRDADRHIKKQDEAIDSLREQLRTANDILIPGLVSANEVMMTRWEAEIAVNKARAVFATPANVERE